MVEHSRQKQFWLKYRLQDNKAVLTFLRKGAKKIYREVVVAQLVERSLPIPEVRNLNAVIGKFLLNIVSCQLYWKDKKKRKRGREWPT